MRARWGKGKREASSTLGRLGLVSGRPEAARRRGAGPAAGGGLRLRCSGGPGWRRAGLGASRRHEEGLYGVYWDRGVPEVGAPRRLGLAAAMVAAVVFLA